MSPRSITRSPPGTCIVTMRVDEVALTVAPPRPRTRPCRTTASHPRRVPSTRITASVAVARRQPTRRSCAAGIGGRARARGPCTATGIVATSSTREHEVRIAHADGVAAVASRRRPRRLTSCGARRVERDQRGHERGPPHVDVGRDHHALGGRARSATSRRPRACAPAARRPCRCPARAANAARQRMPLPLISASPPSALRSVIRAVGPGRRLGRTDGDDAVGADPPVAVAQGHDLGRRECGLEPGATRRGDEEVVAGGVELREQRDRSSGFSAPAQASVQHASISRPAAFTFPSSAIQRTRGSRRNHIRWRRAKLRVRRSARSNAASTVDLARRGREELLVADRLAARSATGDRRGRATSSSRPPRASTRSAARSAPCSTGAVEPHADDRHRRSRAAVRRRPGPKTRTGGPVSSITSSARTMRRWLCSSMRAAACGIDRRSSATPPRAPPGSLVHASSSARTPDPAPAASRSSTTACT